MNTFTRSLLPTLAGTFFLLGGTSLQAGVLTAVGIDQNDPSWRTATVAKPLDGDGDNIYGSAGYFLPRFNSAIGTVAFSTANGTNGTLNTLPSYFTVAAVTPTGNTGPDSAYGGKLAIDNPGAAGTTAASGIAYHNNTANPAGANAFITLTIGTGVPTTSALRVGILSDTSGGGNEPTSFTLAQTTGTGTSTATLTGVQPAAVQADWYFFNISGAAAGDVYTLSIGSAAASSKPTISAITLDVVPEPSTWALLAGGFGSLLALTARRKRCD